MSSPTSRTLEWLRKRSFTAQVVERFNQFAKVRQDLFSVIDVVALCPGRPGVLGVQACAAASHANRLAKVIAEPKARLWLECGNDLWLMSWRKGGAKGKRKIWTERVEVVTLAMFEEAK
jgi:hypothetical protein